MPARKKTSSFRGKKTAAKTGLKRVYRRKTKKSTGLAISAFFIALGLILLIFVVLHIRGLGEQVNIDSKESSVTEPQKINPPAKPQLEAEKIIKKTTPVVETKKDVKPVKKIETPKAVAAKQPQAIVYDKIVTVKKEPVKLSGKPKMIFLIDDIGYHLEHEQLLNDLGDDVVYAILPLLPYSTYFSQMGHQNRANVILHLPLQTINGTVPGRGLITDQMSENQIREMLARNLASVPHHIGSNNHMGSLGTSNPGIMRVVLSEIKRRNLFFIDSVTTSKSVVTSIARELGVRHMKRDIFLDNVDTLPAIRNEVLKQKEIARAQGYAIGIGHYRSTTLSVLKEMIPQLKSEGYDVVSLTELMAYLGI